MKKVMQYLKLIRIKHYLKNVLIFVPAFFGGDIFQKNIIVRLLVSFVSFSLSASFVYIFNDIRDYEQDRLHEEKKKRPIASGKILRREAICIAIACIVTSFWLLTFFDGYRGIPYVLIYILLNIAYSTGLKKIPIMDVVILASGFVLRVLYGAAICNILCSDWLILTIMTVSLYLGLGKRRNESIKNGNGETREVLRKYSTEYLDDMMHMCMTMSIVFYALWSTSIGFGESQNNYFIWTVPIIIILVMKYEKDISGNSFGDPIEVIYKDKILALLSMIYIIVLVIGKYGQL